ncbi:MAG: enoyl-CoA hydratase/isomerase family protein [Candidatus Bathyarchaeia archaeon]
MGNELVRYSTEGGIAVIALNNPPANTYTYPLMRALDEAILTARMDRDVHVLVLRGEGEKFFSAGADIAMLAEADPTFKYYFCLHANETLLRLEQTPKLVIAALNGHTAGGGLEIAMACDIRLAKRDAGRIGLPEVNLGVLPGTGGTQRLARLVGRARAIELMTTGRMLSFEEAHELGLVNDVLAPDDYWDEVLDYARQFVPPNKASRAVGHIKRAVQTGSEIPLAEALALERELQQRLFASSDAAKGLRAYVEKSVARFTGE